jgi:hypothetical protein
LKHHPDFADLVHLSLAGRLISSVDDHEPVVGFSSPMSSRKVVFPAPEPDDDRDLTAE